jgi:sec-independent protein translocase protein TatA
MGLDNPLHIAVLALIVVLVFGAKRVPDIGRSLGKGLREFRDVKDSVTGAPAKPAPPALPEPGAARPPAVTPPPAAPAVTPRPAAPVPVATPSVVDPPTGSADSDNQP